MNVLMFSLWGAATANGFLAGMVFRTGAWWQVLAATAISGLILAFGVCLLAIDKMYDDD